MRRQIHRTTDRHIAVWRHCIRDPTYDWWVPWGVLMPLTDKVRFNLNSIDMLIDYQLKPIYLVFIDLFFYSLIYSKKTFFNSDKIFTRYKVNMIYSRQAVIHMMLFLSYKIIVYLMEQLIRHTFIANMICDLHII